LRRHRSNCRCASKERLAAISVDTPFCGFHNRQEVLIFLTDRQKPLERALEDAVSRALRDNLAPLQRTADELHQAYADLVASCSSSRPTNALPAMLRAQTAASALAAGLSVLSNFVAVALNPRDGNGAGETAEAYASSTQTAVAEPEPEAAAATITAEPESEWADDTPLVPVEAEPPAEAVAPTATVEPEAAFDVASLSLELQELHRRANRVAKVAMQDIKLLRPGDVRLGRENKDICNRLRSDLDKARKEYDRRFRAILDHPVDYFHRWLVEILAEGDSNALGEYPYPSPLLRH
jgi:hypothetical protein